MSPSINQAVGLWVLADGDDGGALHARGSDNPPIPVRCCSVCKGEAHEGQTTALYTDSSQTTPASCGGFALKFVDDPDLGWVCMFASGTQTEPEDPMATPSWWYTES